MDLFRIQIGCLGWDSGVWIDGWAPGVDSVDPVGFAAFELHGLNVSGLPYPERLYSGFSVWASRVGGGLQDQAEYVIRFLEEHKADLLGIVALAGVEDTHLDFGYDCRLHDEGVAMQGDCLPARLVALCGELGLAIMLSLYPTESCPD